MDVARSQLSLAQARAFLGLREEFCTPDDAVLERDAEAIVLRTLQLDQELAHLSTQGLQLSPIWDERDGVVLLRLAVLPPTFRRRYFEGERAREALEGGEIVRLATELVSWIVADPIGGAFALDDTHRVWFDAEAPSRPLVTRYASHFKVLSLLIADGVRKADAGLSTLEWLASLGLPVEESREDDDPPTDAIVAAATKHATAMRAEERTWRDAAFGRSVRPTASKG